MVALGVVVAGSVVLVQACSSHRREVTADWPAYGSSSEWEETLDRERMLAVDSELSAGIGADESVASGAEEEEEPVGTRRSRSAAQVAGGVMLALLSVGLAVGGMVLPFLLL